MDGILGIQNGIGLFFLITEDSEVIVNYIEDYILEAEY